jgi:hypothetical protein
LQATIGAVYDANMKRIPILAASLLAFSAPAHAEIKAQSDAGFNVVHIADVEASADEVWKRLITPKDYWSKEHSWSGSSAGFYIDAQAGGCFCELMQDKNPVANQNGNKAKSTGSVEHMRVIFVQPGRVLRMQGALGPLQSEAVMGTLTVALQPIAGKDGDKAKTKLSFSYVVGGYMRYKVSEIAPAVDKVLGEQFAGLIKPFDRAGAISDRASNWSLDLDNIKDEEAAKDADKPADDGGDAADAKPIANDKFIKENSKKPQVKPAVKSDDAKRER